MSDSGFEGSFETEEVIVKPVELENEVVDTHQSVIDTADTPVTDAPVTDFETAENQPANETEPTPKSLQDQLQEIEDNDNPDKFGQRVKLYSEATVQYLQDEHEAEAVAIQKLLDKKSEDRLPENLQQQFLHLEENIAEIFTQYESQFVQELDGLSGEELTKKAVEVLSQFTGQTVTSEQLTFLDENGHIQDRKSFQKFLAESTSVSKMIEKFALMHEVMTLPFKEQKAVQEEATELTQLIEGDVSKTSDEKKEALEDLKRTTSLMAEAFDQLNLSGVINTIFAVEHGYGSYGRFDAYYNGLEKKNDLSERKTLAALKQVFADEIKRTAFFQGALKLDENTPLKYEEAQPRLKALLEIDVKASTEERQQRALEVKDRLFLGFEKVEKKGFLTSISSPESINLSTTVIQTMVNEIEKIR